MKELFRDKSRWHDDSFYLLFPNLSDNIIKLVSVIIVTLLPDKGLRAQMDKIVYTAEGVCTTTITVEIENAIIRNVIFEGGCDGNTQGVSRLIAGMNAHEALKRLRGIDCGGKGTSCPDQLSRALEGYCSKHPQ